MSSVALRIEHQEYEDRLAFMSLAVTNPELETVPTSSADGGSSTTASIAYVTMESLAALEAFAFGRSENQFASDKHVSMYKDKAHKDLWLLSEGDDHIVSKGIVQGWYGGGHTNARKGGQNGLRALVSV